MNKMSVLNNSGENLLITVYSNSCNVELFCHDRSIYICDHVIKYCNLIGCYSAIYLNLIKV